MQPITQMGNAFKATGPRDNMPIEFTKNIEPNARLTYAFTLTQSLSEGLHLALRSMPDLRNFRDEKV